MTSQGSSYTGYVYLIGAAKFGWYKIGMAKTPEVRIGNLGILLPFKVQIIAIWKTTNKALLESEMHKKYGKRLINGEWFLFTALQVKEIVDSEQPYDALRIYSAFSDQTPKFCFSNVTSNRVIYGSASSIRGCWITEVAQKYLKDNELESNTANNKAAWEYAESCKDKRNPLIALDIASKCSDTQVIICRTAGSGDP